MSKRTREEEGLALALASPECFPSSAALLFCRYAFRKPPRSGGLTQNVKSIARAAIGWSEPVIQGSLNPLRPLWLRGDVEHSSTAPVGERCHAWDTNVTL